MRQQITLLSEREGQLVGGVTHSCLIAEWRVGLIGVSYTAQGAVRIHGYGLQISFVGHTNRGQAGGETELRHRQVLE